MLDKMMQLMRSLLFIVVMAMAAQLTEGLFEWNCGYKYLRNTTTVDFTRATHCYTFSTEILASLENTDEILNKTTQGSVTATYLTQCAKAVIGRGFPVMVMNEQKCHGAREITLFPRKSDPASVTYTTRRGYYCTQSQGYPTIYINTSLCLCGDDFGVGAYFNVYRVAFYTVGLWLKIDDVFNRTSQMFNQSSPEYDDLFNRITEAFTQYWNQTKPCSIPYSMFKNASYVRPSNEAGSIQYLLKFMSSFPNLTYVYEELLKIDFGDITVKEKSIQLIRYTYTSPDLCSDQAILRVKLQFGTNQPTGATTFQRHLRHNVSFEIQEACGNFSGHEIKYYLKVAQIAEDGVISNFTPVCNGSTSNLNETHLVNCSFEPNFVKSGIYYVMSKAWSVNDSRAWSLTYRYINMTKAPVYAGIERVGKCIYTVGRPMMVHGWNSYDSDIYENAQEARPYEKDLNYIWGCYRQGDPSISINKFTISKVGKLRVVVNGAPTGSGGCFGTGVGRLKTNTRSFVFQSDSIAAGSTIVFVLFATKGFRFHKATKGCSVVASPPLHGLRCLFNCAGLMKTTARLGLMPFCNDANGCPAGLEHSWKLFIDTGVRIDIGFGPNETVWKNIPKYKRLTSGDNVYLVVAERVLEQNKTYKIEHHVRNAQNGTFVSSHIFKTNRLPHSGNCTTDKYEIKAAVDSITITCKDWVDVVPFFRYEAWTHSPFTTSKLLYFGNASTFPLKLPLGESNNNFTLRLEIKVFDSYQEFDYFESADVLINLTVTTPALANPGKSLLNMLENSVGVMEEAQVGLAALSLTGTGKGKLNVTAKEKSKILEYIIGSMVNVTANSSQDIHLVTGVLIESTSKPEELSVDGQMLSIQAAMSMSERLSDDNSTDDPAVFDNTGTTLLHLTGNVINGAASKSLEEDNKDGDEENKGSEDNEETPVNATQLKNVAQTAIDATNSISTLLIGKMLGGEKPKTFETPSLGLEIAKTEADKLPETYSVNGGGVNVPSFMKSLAANGTKCPVNATCPAADMFVSSKVTMSSKNPYTWGNGTTKVKSPVISMEYSSSNGSEISVGDIDSDFELKIPQTPPKKPIKLHKFPNFITPDEGCVNHKFFVDKNDTAFEIILPLSEERYMEVFVRYGKRATKTKFDFEYYHPDLTSCVEPPQWDNCTGIENFMECMELQFNETAANANQTLNSTSLFVSTNNTNSSYSNETDFCKNVTIPDVSFLANSSDSRDLSICNDYDYNEPPTCPPCPVLVNGMNSTYEEFRDYNASLKLRPDCPFDNTTNTATAAVCPDLERYLDCKSRTDTAELNLRTCVDYHNIAGCPPCPALVNGTNSTYEEMRDYNASLELRPDCVFDNITNTTRAVVCPKVKRYLACKNRTVEQYKKCEPLLTGRKLIYDKYAKCHKNIYRRFFGIDIFNISGWYYIAMCYNSTQWPPPTTLPPTTTPPPTTTSPPTTAIKTTKSPSTKKATKPTTHKKDKRSLDARRSLDYDNFYLENIVEEGKTETDSIQSEGSFVYSSDDVHEILQRTRRAVNDTSTTNSTTTTRKRTCAKVEEKPPPTSPPIPTEFPPARPQVFNRSSSLNYSFEVNTFTCVFWNATTEMWSTDGCRPHANSSVNQLVCLCNHLTSFGSDLLVAPNAIDLDDVLAGFANLGESGNFSVLFTLIGLFLVYIVVVILARKADKRHELLVSKMVIGRINPRSGFNYEVTVSTGTFRGSGTTANVAMRMFGDNGQTQIIPLADENGHSEDVLSRGNVVTIIVNTPEDIGDLNYIHVWHNNRGKSPSWFLRQITIRNISSNKTWLFIHNDWFAVDESDGQIDRHLYPASESDKKNFKTLFYSHTAKSFSDKHLWISVILRPPSSNFTCVQRITCCFSLLFTAMLANAMFYQNGASDGDQLQIGPIKLSLKQIVIGVQSGLIVAPVNVLIMTLFRKARPKEADKERHPKRSKPRHYKNLDETKENPDENNQKVKKEGLPYWVIYIAYALSLLSVLASATVVLFYSMMWGTEKSNGWMMSVSLSLFQDILVVQPLKVFVIATILSLIFRKPPDDGEEVEKLKNEKLQQHSTASDTNRHTTGKPFQRQYIGDDFKPLKPEIVEEARSYQMKRKTVRSSLMEIALHCTYVLLLSIVLFGSQSSHRYQIHKHLNDVFAGSDAITNTDELWSWCEDVLLPGLYQNQWYNGKDFLDETESFISDKRSILISMPRLRQGRIQSENCDATKDYPKLQKMFPVCYSYYDLSKADEGPPQSSSKLDSSALNGAIGFERMCLQPFIVQSANDLGTLPVVTNDATYSGSGMVADLGYDYNTAKDVILNLKADKWITRQTRIIFAEFVVFEPTSQLYVFGRFTFEKQPTGAIVSSYKIEPFDLYGVGATALQSLIDIFELVLFIFIIMLLIRLLLQINKEKKEFFKDFWNIIVLIMLLLSVVLMVMMIVREMYVASLIKKIKENPYARMSFDYVQFGTDVVYSVAAIVVFLATLKLLNLFRFNMKIQTFAHVLALSKPFLVTYGVIFFVTFFAFAQCANFLFGHMIYMYSNIVRSCVNLFQMALGSGLYFHELKDIDSVLGPLYVFMVLFTTTMLLVNFFVAILNDSYVDGCDTVADDSNEDAIMAAFMSTYIKSSLKDIANDLKKISTKSNYKSIESGSPSGSVQQWIQEIPPPKEEVDYFLY